MQESEPIFILQLAKPSGTSSSSVYTAKLSQGYLNKRGEDREEKREKYKQRSDFHDKPMAICHLLVYLQ